MKSIYLDREQLFAIRQNLKDEEWLVLWVASETGMRIGDVVSLPRCQVGRRFILYRAKKTGKPGKAPISLELYEALQNRVFVSPWLFPSRYKFGHHLTRQAVWARVKKACDRAGINPAGISPHSFRKYFAVELFKRSGLKATQAALQHDRSTTTEIYALSDFSTGSNANLPLLRRDLPMIIELISASICGRYEKGT